MSVADQISALRTNLSNAYDAIETAGGTVPQNKNAANLATAVATISGGGGGGDNNWSEVMSGEANALYDNDITEVREYGLCFNSSGNPYLTAVSFANVTTAGTYAFGYQRVMTSVSMPLLTWLAAATFIACSNLTTVDIAFDDLTSIGNTAFSGCTSLEELAPMPKCRSVGVQAFNGCTSLRKLDFGDNGAQSGTTSARVAFGQKSFYNTSALEALILRGPDMSTISSSDSSASTTFSGSAILAGTGYVYVPSALVNTYKDDSRWSPIANQIRAIEDYSDDGTVNGDIILS